MAATAFVMSTYIADAFFKQRVLNALILGLVTKPFVSSGVILCGFTNITAGWVAQGGQGQHHLEVGHLCD